MANKQIRYGIGFDIDKSGLQDLKNDLSKIQQMSAKEFKINTGSTESFDQIKTKLTSIQKDANTVESALREAFNPKLNTINIETFNKKLSEAGLTLKNIKQSWAAAGSVGESAFRKLATQIMSTNLELKESHSLLDKMGQTLSNTIKWSIASGAINTFTGAIRNAWNYTIRLDSSLNDIRIVTSKSSMEMEEFAKTANKAAKELRSTTTDYTKAALIYYQQGLNEDDVQARSRVTVKAANVTGQSAAEVSEQLTAVWNGYKVVAEEAELYIDKLSAVAATTAADLEELSEGMSKVASGANAMGVDIDQLTAQLSTIVSVTRQDASSVGTALKTIFARMGDLKVDGVDEFGVSLGDVSGTLKQVGIEVLDQQGNLRDMGVVMEEVAGKWGTWTEAQQQAIAVAMAGKRQYNNLLALFENWDMYQSALSTSKNASGTLQKQQEIYTESLEAHLNEIRVAAEKLYDAFFDSDSMKGFLDVLEGIVNQFANFIEMIGGGGNLLLLLGSIAGRVLGKQIGGFIGTQVRNIRTQKENARQTAALEKTLGDLKEANIDLDNVSDENLQKLIKLKERQLKIERFLTDEQKAQNKERLVAIAKEMEESEVINQNLNDNVANYEELFGKDISFRKSGIKDKTAKDIEKEEKRDQDLQNVESIRDQEANDIANANADETSKLLQLQQEKEALMDELASLPMQRQREFEEYEEKSARLKLLQSKMKPWENFIQDESDPHTMEFFSYEEGQAEIDKLTKELSGISSLGPEKESELSKLIQAKEAEIEEQKNKLGELNKEEEESLKKYQKDREKIYKDFEKKEEKAISVDDAIIMAKDKKEAGQGLSKKAESISEDASIVASYKEKTKKYADSFGADVGAGGFINIEDEKQKISQLEEQGKSGDLSKNELKSLQKRKELLSQLEKDTGKYSKANNNLKKRIAELNKDIKSGNSVLNIYQDAIKGNVLNNKQYQKIIKKVEESQKEGGKQVSLTAEELKRLAEAYDLVAQAAQESAESSGAVEEGLRKTQKDVKEKQEELDKEEADADAETKAQEFDARIAKYTEMVGVIASLVGVFSALKGVTEAWSNTDMSAGEWFKQTMSAILGVAMSIIPMIPTLISGFKGMKLGLKGVKKGLNDTGKEAQKTIMKMWPLLVIMLAIVALVGIFALVKNAMDKSADDGKKNYEAAAEAAKSAKEEAEKAKAAYNDLKKAFEDYDKAQEAIDNMTKGTEEWRNAIQEANMQVLELIDKYPELAQYVSNVDGQLKISDAGREVVEDKLEQDVQQAQRTSMIANVQKLRAKNSMIAQQGSTDSLSRVVVGYGNNQRTVSEEERDAAYRKAIEVVNEKGSAILEEDSFEAFAKAMEGTDSALINALWEHKTELAKNAAAVAANTAAIDLQKQQAAASYLESENEIYQNVDDIYKESISQAFANVTDINSKAADKFKDQYNWSDKDERDALAKKYAEQNNIDAQKTEIDEDNATITYTLANGESRTVHYDTARASVVQQEMYESSNLDLEQYQQELENVYNTVGANGGEAMGKAFINMSNGQAANFENAVKSDVSALGDAIAAAEISAAEAAEANDLTGSGKDYDDEAAELEELQKAQEDAGKNAVAQYLGFGEDLEAFEEYAKKEGYKSGDAYVEAIKEGIENYNDEIAKIGLGLATTAKAALDSLNLEETYSITTQKAVASSMEKVFEQAGQTGVDVLKSYIESADLSDADLANFSKIVENIDWKDNNAINELNLALEEQGISIDKTSEEWGAFIDGMAEVESAAYTLTKGFDAIANSLKTLQELSKGLNIGEAIDEENYKKLIEFNKELENFFVRTHEGYVYLGGADGALTEATNNVLDLDKLKDEYGALGTAQGSLQNTSFFETDENGKLKIKQSNQEELFNEIAGNTEYSNFIKARTGYSAERIASAENIENALSTVDGFEGFTNSQLKSLDNANAAALAKWYVDQGGSLEDLFNNAEDPDQNGGLSYDEIAAYFIKEGYGTPSFAVDSAEVKAALNAKTDAEKQISDAKKIRTDVINAAVDFVNADLVKESRETQTATLSTRFNTYKEMMDSGITAGLDEKAVEDAGRLLLAREATDLGVDASAWSAYVATGKTSAEQNAALGSARVKKLYEEVDMYAEINKEIETINKNVDDWRDGLDKLSAARLLQEYENIDSKFQEIRVAAGSLLTKERAEQINEAAYLNSFIGAGIAAETGNNAFDLSDLYDEGTRTYNLETIREAMLADPGNENLRNYYNQILEYNNKVLESTEKHADTIAQSYEDQLDMTIEAFNKKAEIRIDLENTLKDLDQFKRELDKTGWSMFEDADALGAYTSAMRDYGFDTNALDSSFNDLAAFNGGAGNKNDFTNKSTGAFNETAYKEAYDAAIDRAKENYESVTNSLNQMYDSYFTAQEELVDLYESQIEKLSNINNILNSQVEISKLLKKNTGDSATLLKTNYAIISENRRKSHALALAELNTLQTEYNNAREHGNEEMIRTTEENLIAVAEKVASSAQEMFTAISDEFGAMLSATVDDFLVAATGADLSTITEDWERDKAQEERYLDDVNADYGINELMRKFDKSIDETDSYSAKRKLVEQRIAQENKLNDILEERGKISQYELDRANAEYELTLKQIALEEAQQTASKMKLTRDASGNYSYQYVADESAVAEAQAELEAAQNELYNLDKSRNKELVDEYYNTMTEANEAISAAIAAGDEERAEELKQYYFGENGILEGIKNELGVASENLQDIGQEIMGPEWTSSIKEYTDEIKEMNLAQLSTDIGTLITTTGDELELVKGSLETLIGENSPLTVATTALNNSLLSADALAVEQTKLATLTNEILTKLPDIQSYADRLKTYITDYENYLKTYAGKNISITIENATNAIKDLTLATLANIDMLDNSMNGKNGDNDIVQAGYSFNGTAWIFGQQAETE